MTSERPSEPIGLRERKKLATRAALSGATLRLATERGFDRVRVDEIAAEAGVSPRTFNNYFSSKEEAVVSLLFARVDDMRAALRGRPAGEPVWDVIAAAALAQLPPEEIEPWREGLELIRQTPTLEAEYLKAHSRLEEVIAVEVAERTGLDLRLDLRPRLAACVAVAAIRAALQHWLDNHPHYPASAYPDLLRRAVSEAGAGLRLPETRRTAGG